MKVVFGAFLVGLFSVSAYGAPLVESIDVSGSPEKMTVISGQNFGDFGGEILSWDDFEHHALGTKVGNAKPVEGHDWSAIYGYDGEGIVIDSTRSVSGDKAIKLDWSIDSHSIRAFGWSGKGPYSELYISYWRYMEGDYNSDQNDNHKQFYLYGGENGFPQLMPLIPAGNTKWGVYNNVGDSNISWSERNNMNTKGWSWENTSSKYQRWEVYTKLNQPYSDYNGVIQVRVDGELGIATDSYRIRNVNSQFEDFRLGHMAQGFSESAKAWFDDVYIASTRARVEICDSNSYEDCRTKHIQYVDPANWSDSKIELTIRNAQYFKQGPVFLYVVDKNGSISEAKAIPRPVMN